MQSCIYVYRWVLKDLLWANCQLFLVYLTFTCLYTTQTFQKSHANLKDRKMFQAFSEQSMIFYTDIRNIARMLVDKTLGLLFFSTLNRNDISLSMYIRNFNLPNITITFVKAYFILQKKFYWKILIGSQLYLTMFSTAVKNCSFKIQYAQIGL